MPTAATDLPRLRFAAEFAVEDVGRSLPYLQQRFEFSQGEFKSFVVKIGQLGCVYRDASAAMDVAERAVGLIQSLSHHEPEVAHALHEALIASCEAVVAIANVVEQQLLAIAKDPREQQGMRSLAASEVRRVQRRGQQRRGAPSASNVWLGVKIAINILRIFR